MLRHLEGMSISEAGATLGLSDSATKQSVFRAVQKLRQELGGPQGNAANVAEAAAPQPPGHALVGMDASSGGGQ